MLPLSQNASEVRPGEGAIVSQRSILPQREDCQYAPNSIKAVLERSACETSENVRSCSILVYFYLCRENESP